jgi:hypothetical protein
VQDYITSIYNENPRPEDNPLRVHPVISALAWEYKLAYEEDREPQYDQITFASIKKRIEATEKSQPLWPSILKSTSLATKAEKDPRFTWWLRPDPEYSEEEKEEKEDVAEVASGERNDEGEDDRDEGTAGTTGAHTYFSFVLRDLTIHKLSADDQVRRRKGGHPHHLISM